MNLNVQGKAVKFGDNINTDVILPGKYLELIDPEELGKHALEGLDPTFAQRAREGVIIVGGKNFGCGSSREQAPIALKGSGVKCVLEHWDGHIHTDIAIPEVNVHIQIVALDNEIRIGPDRIFKCCLHRRRWS